MLARELTSTTRTVSVQSDEEHNAFLLKVEDRTGGYHRRHVVGVDFAASPEYRALLGCYGDVQGLDGPMLVATAIKQDVRSEKVDAEGHEAVDAGMVPTETGTSADMTNINGAPPSIEPRQMGNDREVTVGSLKELVELFITAGKRGVAINRYKGLGEMNPDQLWVTTMKPEDRTLLQVRAEDEAEADLMFTTLMGDQVEPRRKFIEDNALDVKNLDV